MPSSTQKFRLVGEDDASRAFLQVAAASRLLKSNIDDVTSSLGGLAKLSGGASLIPLLAGTAAATAELTTSLLAAGGAAGVFGVSAAGFIVDMKGQQEQIGKLQLKLKSLEKGSDSYNKTLAQLHTAQKSFNADFGPAADGFNKLQDAYSKFEDKTRPITQGVLVKGMDVLADALPKLVPVSNAAGKALGGLTDDLDNWVNGPGFDKLLHFLETSGPKDITAFGHIIGNTLGGLGGILENFVGPGDSAAATLERLTERFDAWGHSRGVSRDVDSFLKYVHNNGPEIASTFESLSEATPKIAGALGELGSANLTLTSKFLSLVAGLPQKQFNLIADGLFAIAAGSKALTLVTGLGAVGKGLTGLLAGKGLVGKGTSGFLAGKGGVQHVWVDNPGFGGKDTPPGVVGKTAGFLEKELPFGLAAGGVALTVGGALAIASVAAITIGTAALSAKAIQLMSEPGKVPLPGRPTDPRDAANAERQRINDLNLGPEKLPLIPDIKSTTTAIDSMRNSLDKASRGVDLVGAGAHRVFPDATKKIEAASLKLQQINGVKAEQSFDLVGHSAAKNTASAGRDVDVLTGKLNHIPDKQVNVTASTGEASANVARLQYQVDQLHGKTIIIRTTGGHVPGEPHASGGYITGPGTSTSDSILARLSNGEFVMTARAVRKYGRARLMAMNALRYASGGYVGDLPTPTRTHDKAGTVVNYNINVTAPVGSDAYTIGETLKQYLDDYESASVS